MAVIDPFDDCGYVSIKGKVVKFTNADGTLTNSGRPRIIDTALRIETKAYYEKQICLLVAGEEYKTHLANLRTYYVQLSDLKMSNDITKYMKIEVRKDKLVDKLKRGFIDFEFTDRFEEYLKKLDSILESIHPE